MQYKDRHASKVPPFIIHIFSSEMNVALLTAVPVLLISWQLIVYFPAISSIYVRAASQPGPTTGQRPSLIGPMCGVRCQSLPRRLIRSSRPTEIFQPPQQGFFSVHAQLQLLGKIVRLLEILFLTWLGTHVQNWLEGMGGYTETRKTKA